MKKMTIAYSKKFVINLNAACEQLGLVRSQFFKKTMEEIIKKAEEEK